jgi:hypothetical protein
MLRGRRAGNLVLIAGAAVPDRIGPVIAAAELGAFAAGAQARLDAPR